jgi:hypothetical protein
MKTLTGMAQSDSVTDSTTIEVMLSAQQVHDMTRGSQFDAAQQQRSKWFMVAAGLAALVVLGGAAHLTAKQKTAPAAVVQAVKPTPPPPPTEVTVSGAEPVLYKNPFDRSEVFEFPAGTTQDAARDRVAQVLLERAQGRGPDVLKLKIRKVHASARAQ